jgi:ABC-type sugar transport system permease subunit
MVASAWMTFTDWTILKPPVFIGLDNYAAFMEDPLIL